MLMYQVALMLHFWKSVSIRVEDLSRISWLRNVQVLGTGLSFLLELRFRDVSTFNGVCTRNCAVDNKSMYDTIRNGQLQTLLFRVPLKHLDIPAP
jgi:hypothetical protein